MCLTQVFPREPIEDDLDGYFKDRVMLVLVFFNYVRIYLSISYPNSCFLFRKFKNRPSQSAQG